jgi:hypothetical protein
LGESGQRLSHAVAILDATEVRGKKSITSVLNEVADRLSLSYDYVSEIHYDPDPGWKLAVKAERAFKYEMAAKPLALWFWDVQLQFEGWMEPQIFVANGKKAWRRPCVEQVSSVGVKGWYRAPIPGHPLTACTIE